MSKSLNLILILLTISFSFKAQYVIDTPYEYPIKPGSEEWATFTTGQQMVDACQIPTDILSKLTTKALAETCMNYPLYFQYTASNDERDGIAYMINSFNGLQELSKRKDGVYALLNLYEKMPVSPALLAREASGNRTILHLGYIELLLSNEIFFNELSNEDISELKKITIRKYEEKVSEKNVYSMFGIQKSLLLGAKVLEKNDFTNKSISEQEAIKKFIKLYDTSDHQIFVEITKLIVE